MSHSSQTPQRCLLLSYVFAPSTGGIETVSGLLAEGLVDRGYDIRVVTHTPADAVGAQRGYDVLRNPTARQLLRQLHWCDVVLQANFSFRLSWPLVCGLVSRPWVVVHHTPLTRPSGEQTLRDRLKIHSMRKAQCYAVSAYLASTVGVKSGVLLNPYDDRLFQQMNHERGRNGLVFLGRLVPAKGADVLLRALGLLKSRSLSPNLTIVGDGPEESSLRALSESLGLTSQVRFLGRRSGAELVRVLNEHQVLVVPSRAAPPEALPVVPLEGIACGCIVIAANQGGLPESVGPCGVTFESESSTDLAEKIATVLASPQRQAAMRSGGDSFLRRFSRQSVLEQYESVIQRAMAPMGVGTPGSI